MGGRFEPNRVTWGWVMTRTRLVAVAAVVALVVAGVVVGLVQDRDPSAPKAARPVASGSPSVGATPLKGATTNKQGSADSEIAPVQTVPATVAPGEGLPGVSTPAPTSGPLIGYSVRRAAAAKGRMVAGFPRRRIPAVPTSTIDVSSVSPSPGRLQIALTATTRASYSAVLRFYSVQLSRYGFVSTRAPAVGGSHAASYTRGQDSLVVSVTPDGSSSSYSVSGTLRTSGS